MNLNRYLGHLAFNNVFEQLFKKDETSKDAQNFWLLAESACNILQFLKTHYTCHFIKTLSQVPDHLNSIYFALVKQRQLQNSACRDSYVVP